MATLIITLEDTQKPISPDDLLKLYPEAVATSTSGNTIVGVKGESLERMTKAIHHEEGCNRKIAIWESSDDPEEGFDPIAFAEWGVVAIDPISIKVGISALLKATKQQRTVVVSLDTEPDQAVGAFSIEDAAMLTGLGLVETHGVGPSPTRLRLTQTGEAVAYHARLLNIEV